jgi:hypothetical protein
MRLYSEIVRRSQRQKRHGENGSLGSPSLWLVEMLFFFKFFS